MNFLNYYDQMNQGNRFENNTMQPQQQPAPMMGQMPSQGMNDPMQQSQQPDQPPYPFKRGGKVKGKKTSRLAEIIRRQGNHGDNILAHINPQEAAMLKQAGGSGTTNPKTGLPQFFFKGVQNFVKNPGKTVKKSISNPKRTLADLIATAATVAGAVTGNPYIAAAGGGARSAIRGDKENPLIGALKSTGYSTGLNALGNMAGSSLVAPEMSWTTPFSAHKGKALGVSAGDMSERGGSLTRAEKEGLTNEYYKNAEKQALIKSLEPKPSFMEKAGDFLTKPETMLTLGTLGLNAYNSLKPEKKEKKISPEEKANEIKRYRSAMQLSPEEIQNSNEYLKLLEGRSNNDSSMLERKRYRKASTPEEMQKTGKAFAYYDNPNFSGTPEYKKGGEIMRPGYINGNSGGQDDKIKTNLQDGGYILDAYTVSGMGDGNSMAGAHKLDKMLEHIPAKVSAGEYYVPPSKVDDIGDGSNEKGVHILDVMRKDIKKKRGGKITARLKSKSIIDCFR